MKRLAVIALVVAIAGCSAFTDPEDATRVLENAGYTQVKMTGYQFMACSKDDTYHTGFEATAPNGKRVRGTVCAGFWFKNSTIRFE